ncbi:MAG: response regulator transcription factor [Pseudomonadota bacterium]
MPSPSLNLRLLVVEDDRDVVENIAEYFEPKGFVIDFAYDGKSAITLAEAWRPDVILLDLGLPRLDGIAVSAALRNAGCETPIVVMTARDTLDDKAAAFDVGIDDYIVKPFALAELEMRINAVHRRTTVGIGRQILEVSDLRFDLGRREVCRQGQPIQLNRTHQRILEVLMSQSPNVVPKSQLLERVWADDPPGPDALRTNIYELRIAIDRPYETPLIHTVHGQGYAIRSKT